MDARVTLPVTDVDQLPHRSVQLVARIAGRETAPVALGAEGVVVGSADGCDLIIDHPTVSARHAELRLRNGDVWVTDLDSRNGTRFQGSRVKEAFIPVGATLFLGDATLLVIPAAPRSAVRLGPLVSVAPQMMQAISALAQVASTDVTVLLEAETGCGKEITARAIHDASKRANAPFETVDCGALPNALAASELFGHLKGAFTGADRTRPGAFERAHKGTLFLDEIGELPAELQPLLLRALENRQIRRVGDDAYRPIDVRVIAATNRDLTLEVNAGRFRLDLLHRLAVVRVRLPPLRERREDIPMLVRAILDSLGPRAAGFSLSPDTLRALAAQEWTGNIRELRNVIERTLAMGPAQLESPEPASLRADVDYKSAREKAMDAFEREFVVHVLSRFDRNVSRAARESGIDRAYLHKLIKKHAIEISGV
jgi:two-component system, NtrC family, response regulator GlrR